MYEAVWLSEPVYIRIKGDNNEYVKLTNNAEKKMNSVIRSLCVKGEGSDNLIQLVYRQPADKLLLPWENGIIISTTFEETGHY